MKVVREEVAQFYSHIVVHGSTVYLAGQIPEDFDKDIAGQAQEVLAKIDRLLSLAGTSKSNLLSVTVYLKDFADYARFNATYADWLDPANKPARATVRADLMAPDIRIEISAVAARPAP